jgi:RNA polymerase sigma-70 factor (ECF subfamily)
VRDRTDAADVLQDVFWEAWRGAGAYDARRGTREAWMITRARTRS